MKNKLIFLTLLSLASLNAATSQWSATPSNADWNYAANWTPQLPASGSDISFGNSTIYDINYTGSNTYNQFTFSNGNKTGYNISLINGASLAITGPGLIDTTTRNYTTDPWDILYIKDGSSITLLNNAAIDSVRIINLNGYLTFADNSSAGTGDISNAGLTLNSPPTAILFTDHATAGSATFYNYGSAASITFDKNSTAGTAGMYNTGNFSDIIFTGNSTTDRARIVNNGTDAQLHFTGNAIIGNASAITTVTSNGLNSTATYGGFARSINLSHIANGGFAQVTFTDNFIAASGNFSITANATSGRIWLLGNASIQTGNFLITANGNVAQFFIGENASITGSGAIFAGSGGTYGSNIGIITGNAVINPVSGFTNITSNGTTSIITVNGHATVNKGVFSNNGLRATMVVGGNSTITNSTFAVSRLGAVLRFEDYATVTGNAANFITANVSGSAIEVLGNAAITGTAVGANIFNLSQNVSLTVGGNATISTGRIDLNNANAKLRIQDNADLSTITIVSRHTTAIQMAMAPNATFTINNIHQTALANTLEIAFTDSANQHLIYNALGSATNTNITFTETPGLRASVTHNATATLALRTPNTITGEFTIARGTVTANTSHALATATLNITATGNFATNQTALTLGGLAGNGTLDTTGADYQIGNNSRDSAFSGNIAGSGNLAKIGDGTLSLTATASLSAYTGQLAVNSGALALDNADITTYVRPIAVNTGGALATTGNSAANILNLADGSAFQPSAARAGNLITSSRLAAAEFNFTSNTLFRVALNPRLQPLRPGDRLDAIVTATTLTLDGAPLAPAVVLSHIDARTTLNNALGFILSFDPATNSLDLTATQLPFADFATTPNQRAAAAALDTIPDPANSALINRLNTIDNTDNLALPAALNDLAPSSLAAMPALAHRQAATDLRLVTQRLDQYRRERAQQHRQPLPLPDPTATAENFIPTAAAGTRILAPARYDDFAVLYFNIRHAQGTQDGSPDTPGYDHDGNGVTFGMELPSTRRNPILGLQFTYEKSTAQLDRNAGEIELNTLRFLGYLGAVNRRNLWLQAHASVNIHAYDTTRNLPAFAGQNKGDTDALGFTGSMEIGKTYNFKKPRARLHLGDNILEIGDQGAWTHAPYARLAYDMLDIGGFTESGAVPVTIESQLSQSLVTRLAWRLNYEHTLRNGTALLAGLDLGWEHEYLDAADPEIDFRFAGSSTATARGPESSRDSLVAALTLQAITAKNLYLALSYDLDYNADYLDHRLTATLGKKF